MIDLDVMWVMLVWIREFRRSRVEYAKDYQLWLTKEQWAKCRDPRIGGIEVVRSCPLEPGVESRFPVGLGRYGPSSYFSSKPIGRYPGLNNKKWEEGDENRLVLTDGTQWWQVLENSKGRDILDDIVIIDSRLAMEVAKRIRDGRYWDGARSTPV